MLLINSVSRYAGNRTFLAFWSKRFILNRNISQKSSRNNDVNNPNQTFKRIYYFPYIRLFSMVNKLKLYHSALTAFSLPFSLGLHYAGVIPGIHMPILGIGIVGCMWTYSLGAICSRVVGAVYIHENGDQVKISYVNFWGQRTDELYTLDNILYLSAPGRGLAGVFQSVNLNSPTKSLKISVVHGDILDLTQFDRVFNNFRLQLKQN